MKSEKMNGKIMKAKKKMAKTEKRREEKTFLKTFGEILNRRDIGKVALSYLKRGTVREECEL